MRLVSKILLPDAVFSCDSTTKSIYLTYDDGPEPEVTPKLLDILAEHQARTTFFVIYQSERWWSNAIREIAAGGHQVALHGLRHRSGYLLSNKALFSELTKLTEAIRDAGVEPLLAYRPPFGHVRPDTVKYLRRRGFSVVLWSNIPGDYQAKSPHKLIERATHNLKPGDILTLHDGTELRPAPTLALTKGILEYSENKGWVSDCLNLP